MLYIRLAWYDIGTNYIEWGGWVDCMRNEEVLTFLAQNGWVQFTLLLHHYKLAAVNKVYALDGDPTFIQCHLTNGWRRSKSCAGWLRFGTRAKSQARCSTGRRKTPLESPVDSIQLSQCDLGGFAVGKSMESVSHSLEILITIPSIRKT
ncbi:hypothetical protein MPER_12917 [Moniliophthora perniciosa FA553]|nr:hypothetical protein MPER_12917 [Moniliophthora perniciosa FA553]